MARWTAAALLSGVDIIKLGYISRSSFKSSKAHQLLGTQTVKPRDFAAQMNLNMDNAWGITKALLTFCFDQTENSSQGMFFVFIRASRYSTTYLSCIWCSCGQGYAETTSSCDGNFL